MHRFFRSLPALALCAPVAVACHASGDDDHAGAGGSSNANDATGGSGTAAGGTPSTAAGGTPGTSGTTNTAGAAAGSLNAAGTTGGASADSDPIPPGNPCDTALYCDDFESYDTAPNGKWTPRTSSGSVAIDTTEHASGSKSVKFTTQAASSATAMIRIQDPSIFPVPGNVFYGRMMFYVESVPMQSVHWTMLEGLGIVPGQTYHALYRYGGQLPVTQGSTFVGSQLMANYDTPDWYSDKSTPGSDCWHHANGRVVPVATWTCVEWKFDGPNDGMKLWLDGVAAPDLTIAGHGDSNNGDGCVNANNNIPWAAPSFASLDVGWESYQMDDPRTVYVDDVAISTTRIGCPN
ncbi:MAG TPA: hypothetical protein VMI54_21485 [Polyangiaceae bacterium]|nr:hypothetical protein [Polyangiaceae bacterium]